MSDETNDQGVNTDDRVTADHDAGIGSPADELETHNPDIDDYDQVVEDIDSHDDDEGDPPGGAIKTDEPLESDDDSGEDDDEEARIPKGRFDDVNERMKTAEQTLRDRELEWARKEAILEGRLAALERQPEPEEAAPVKDPFDDVLDGEPQAILDAFQEDPAAFIRAIQGQAKAATAAEIAERQAEERYQYALQSELDKFAKNHEDFMPNANKLVEIMNGNPMHNVISAYAYEIEIPALQAKIEEASRGVEDQVKAARAEGIAEGKKQAIKEIQAKGHSAVLDGSAAKQSSGKANTGIETDGDGMKLRAEITKNLLKKRSAG